MPTERGCAGRVATRRQQAALAFVVACLAAVLLSPVHVTRRHPGALVVSIEFDDTLADQLSVRSILAEHGMHATFFVNSGVLDRPGYLTVAQLRALASDGHEIGGHTMNHVRLPGLKVSEQRRQICDDRRALLALGFAVSDFAYPWGAHDNVSVELVRSCGYDSGRRAGGLAFASCILCPRTESIPPPDPTATRAPGSLTRDQGVRTIKALIRGAQQDGGWIQLIFHHVCDACGKYSISRQDFSTLLDWLAEERDAGRVVVLTVRQVIHGEVPR